MGWGSGVSFLHPVLRVSEAEGPNWDWVRRKANGIFLPSHSLILKQFIAYLLGAKNFARLLGYIGKADNDPCTHGAHTFVLAVPSPASLFLWI